MKAFPKTKFTFILWKKKKKSGFGHMGFSWSDAQVPFKDPIFDHQSTILAWSSPTRPFFSTKQQQDSRKRQLPIHTKQPKNLIKQRKQEFPWSEKSKRDDRKPVFTETMSLNLCLVLGFAGIKRVQDSSANYSSNGSRSRFWYRFQINWHLSLFLSLKQLYKL